MLEESLAAGVSLYKSSLEYVNINSFVLEFARDTTQPKINQIEGAEIAAAYYLLCGSHFRLVKVKINLVLRSEHHV